MDGVLIESFDAWVAVLDECRARRGLPALGAAGVRATWGQGIAEDCRSLFPGTSVDELSQEYDEGFERHVGLVRAIPGARELVEAAHASETPRAVVTNSPVAMARRVLDQVGLIELLPVLTGGDEVERGKPDPAMVRLALERLGRPAAGSVLLGDTPLDVRAARAAGVFALGYQCEADARVESLREAQLLLGLDVSN
jgi:HAD superfamily hydrolase (TIGR01509 family)